MITTHLDEVLKNFGNIKTDDGKQVYNLLKKVHLKFIVKIIEHILWIQ